LAPPARVVLELNKTQACVVLSIWLPDPMTFFAIFDEVRKSSSSSASMFFGKKAASKKSKSQGLPEAAFCLLQWAQHGETFDFQSSSSNSSDGDDDNDDQDNMVVQADDELEASSGQGLEDEVPEWAKSVATDDSSKTLPEMDAPKSLKADLRPYQRQALYWMMQREEDSISSKDLKDQLKLLAELAPDKSSATSLSPPANKSIHCECGPVLVSKEATAKSPSVDGGNPESAQVSHPLWERRYIASHEMTETSSFYVQPLFGAATSSPPPPPKACRGGILADSMGK
jgi:hypothetical protein